MHEHCRDVGVHTLQRKLVFPIPDAPRYHRGNGGPAVSLAEGGGVSIMTKVHGLQLLAQALGGSGGAGAGERCCHGRLGRRGGGEVGHGVAGHGVHGRVDIGAAG